VSVLLFWILFPSFVNSCPSWGEKLATEISFDWRETKIIKRNFKTCSYNLHTKNHKL